MLSAEPEAQKRGKAKQGDRAGAGVSEAEPTREAAPMVTPRAKGTSAHRVYLDPRTGRLLSAPPRGAQPTTAKRTGTESTPELLPNGGYRMRLNGRFRSSSVATVGEGGRVTQRCVGGHDASDAGASGENGAHEHGVEGTDEPLR